MNFEERSAFKVFICLVDHSSKLLLAGTNPKIDREKEGEFNAEVIWEKSKNGVIFWKFLEASEWLQIDSA